MTEPREWTATIAVLLEPTLRSAGLRRVGHKKFVGKSSDGERRFILSERYPRYADDKRRLYVAPAVHVYFPKAAQLSAEVTGEELRPGYPTIGGSLGVYTPEGSYIEHGLSSDADIPSVVKRIENEIREIALPFWERFSSLGEVAVAIEQNHPWLPADAASLPDLIAIIYLTRGIEGAARILEERGAVLDEERRVRLVKWIREHRGSLG